MEAEPILTFVGIIVGSVIIAGAVNSGLAKIAKALEKIKLQSSVRAS